VTYSLYGSQFGVTRNVTRETPCDSGRRRGRGRAAHSARQKRVGWLPAPIAADNGQVAVSRNPVAIVTEGSLILGEVLSPAGFTFQLTNTGRSSGGVFTAGRFTKGSQYLEFHFRHSLGLIVYGWGDTTLCHADYLRGLDATGSYPGYSTDPLDGFRHLALDLAGPLSGFRDGDCHGYDQARRAAKEASNRKLP
jgi:hypothetical protein